ncbi:inositol monophosphatase family protein [Histidinibacterium aquaticum]|uniref:Inositol monophosphatase n=1 Tax=Histidinibacterium aquaticum TaxID=2613962 RepID=A0A5J5GMF9_9RHOB|nr:inositol monophosphatase family protein [Histidinibacterium aquaticum]KAA9009350.1 inositol monophosphatase [Histidinibacterium aquaticum]
MSLSRAEEEGLVGLVREVASREILPRFRRLDATEIRAKGRPDDLVTAADLASEAALADGIGRVMPGAAVVGEEAVASDPSVLDRLDAPGRVVVVDPIDGTWNFAHGLATFGVILAVVEDGETVFGLLYDPVFDDWVLTRRGGGTWMCRAGEAPVRLQVGPAPGLGEAQGFVPLFLFGEADRDRIAGGMVRTGRAGSLRCSCHEYRQLVLGGGDFALAAMLKPWDHAAGALALAEAGGVAALTDGTAYVPRLREGHMIAATGEALRGEVAAVYFGG